ncbi:short-chain dehydrogenase/reductase SDR [Rhodopirellula maiorica SM1]|uniref:Short-chain dehydrogenase/reductase SDR n=1 Tax=Rhodopirellula maiorica SM1 TaxID=1265738 RepID=M5RQU1_9BACT|nr:SDR family NAD(P)-dependent oxidoreductase [Rhodopirellula maiorica]EMI16304.1 short-chain dehydrogenase/reductase SDR [Rhodopirellula maiorica SM1]
MRWNPKDSIAVVTGASSGIGHCLCELLLDRGATVVAVARRGERLADLGTRNCPGRLIPVVGDVTDAGVRAEILAAAADVDGGRLDLLVNNAGIGAIGPFADANEDRLRRIMEVNFFAPAELMRHAIPMLRRGRNAVICNISSVLGHRAVPDKSEYCASKFALHGLSDSLRAELAGDTSHGNSIQVTLVSPSTTRSEFFDSLIGSDDAAQSKSIGSWPPAKVARATMAAIESRRSEVILSLAGKALVYADRISPPLMNAILTRSN